MQPAAGSQPSGLARGQSTNTLRRQGSKQAITLVDMRGGKKSAKELAGRLQRLHQADAVADDHAGQWLSSSMGTASQPPVQSPVLSPNDREYHAPFFGADEPSLSASHRGSADPSTPPPAASGGAPPQKFAALESMLQSKLETSKDGGLADYHILTHKKDARSQKKAAISGRHIGSRFNNKQAANFDVGLLNDFLSLRNQRVQQTIHATLDRPQIIISQQPAAGLSSPADGFSPAHAPSKGFSPAHAPKFGLRSPANSTRGSAEDLAASAGGISLDALVSEPKGGTPRAAGSGNHARSFASSNQGSAEELAASVGGAFSLDSLMSGPKGGSPRAAGGEKHAPVGRTMHSRGSAARLTGLSSPPAAQLVKANLRDPLSSRSSQELGRFSSSYIAPSAANVMGLVEVEDGALHVEEDGDDSDEDESYNPNDYGYRAGGNGSSANVLGRHGSGRQSISESLNERDLYPNRQSIVVAAPDNDGPVMPRKYTLTKDDQEQGYRPSQVSTQEQPLTRQPSSAGILHRVGSVNRFAPPPPAGPAPPEATLIPTTWREVIDPEGRRYFYDEETMETTWTQPAHFLRHDEGLEEDEGAATFDDNRASLENALASQDHQALSRHGSARSVGSTNGRRPSGGRRGDNQNKSVLAARGANLPGLDSTGDLLKALTSSGGARRSFTSSLGSSSTPSSRNASLTTDLDAPSDKSIDGGGDDEEQKDEKELLRGSMTNGVARRMSEFIVENASQFHFEDPMDEEGMDEAGMDEGAGLGMLGAEAGDEEVMPAITALRRGSHTVENTAAAARRASDASGALPTGGGSSSGQSSQGSLYWWDLKPSEGGTWDPATRLWRAGVYCRDAINERPIKLHRASRTPLAVYAFVQSDGWNRLYVTVSLLHLCLLFLEPASWRLVDPHTLQYDSSGIFVLERKLQAYPHFDGALLAGVEACLLLVYALDSALSLYALGLSDLLGVGLERRLLALTSGQQGIDSEESRRNLAKGGWWRECCDGWVSALTFGYIHTGSRGSAQQTSSANTRFDKTRLMLWACMAFDLFTMVTVAHSSKAADVLSRPVRWSRPLRALMPMVASSELRRWSKMILLTTPDILVLAAFLFLIMTIYGIIGIHLFAGDASCYAVANARAAQAGIGDEYPKYVVKAFLDIGHALVTMYVLSTTESYPLVMYPAYDCHPRQHEESRLADTAAKGGGSLDHFYASFFVSFLVIIMFGINVLSVPMLYSGLIKHITADAAIGRRLERTALHAAFELMDVEDRGFLDMDQFACLVQQLRPELFVEYKSAVAVISAQAKQRDDARKRLQRYIEFKKRTKLMRDAQKKQAGCLGFLCIVLCDCLSCVVRCLWGSVKAIARGVGCVWRRLVSSVRGLVGVPVYTEFGTAFEGCYPEIRRLRRRQAVPSGYVLASFSPQEEAVKGMTKRKRRQAQLRFAIKNPGTAAEASSFGAAAGAFVEKPQFAGCVELMFGQLAHFDDNDGQNGVEGRIGPLEFFKCAEVVLRDFHSVEVLKQRDSLYTTVFGRRCGVVCGGLRDRLLFDGWWKSGLRFVDLSLTFAHVIVLALHRNGATTLAKNALWQSIERSVDGHFGEAKNDDSGGAIAVEKWNTQLYRASGALTLAVGSLLVAKLVVLRPKRFFKNKSNRVDCFVVPMALLANFFFGGRPSPYQDIGAMIMSVRLLRLVLSVSLFKRLYVLLVGREYLVFTLQSVFLLIALWSTVGMMLFAGNFDPKGVDPRDMESASGSGITDPNLGFGTFALALFTIFQVFTTSNWHEIMYRCMAASTASQGYGNGNIPAFVAPLYFISFHYFITTVVMQLMIAILVEMYIQISSDPNLSNLLSGGAAFERASTATGMNDSSGSLVASNHTASNDQRRGSKVQSLDRHGSGTNMLQPNGSQKAMAVVKRTQLPIHSSQSPVHSSQSSGPSQEQTGLESASTESALDLLGSGPSPGLLSNDVPAGFVPYNDDTINDALEMLAYPATNPDVKRIPSIIDEGNEHDEDEGEPFVGLDDDKLPSPRARSRSDAPPGGLSPDIALVAPTRGSTGGGGGGEVFERKRAGSTEARLSSHSEERGPTSVAGDPRLEYHRRRAETVTRASALGVAKPSQHRVRANESSFKQTASALHVLARRTDKGAFDAVDRELGQTLTVGAGSGGFGEGGKSTSTDDRPLSGGGGRRSVVGEMVMAPPEGMDEEGNTAGNRSSLPRGGGHITLRGLGKLAVMAARSGEPIGAAAGDASGGGGSETPPSDEVEEIRLMMLEAASSRVTLTPDQAAKVRQVMMRTAQATKKAGSEPNPAGDGP